MQGWAPYLPSLPLVHTLTLDHALGAALFFPHVHAFFPTLRVIRIRGVPTDWDVYGVESKGDYPPLGTLQGLLERCPLLRVEVHLAPPVRTAVEHASGPVWIQHQRCRRTHRVDTDTHRR